MAHLRSRQTRRSGHSRDASATSVPVSTERVRTQTPSTMSHSGFLTRSESCEMSESVGRPRTFCGSRRDLTSTLLASSISCFVRCLIKTGSRGISRAPRGGRRTLPRHLMMMFFPSGLHRQRRRFRAHAHVAQLNLGLRQRENVRRGRHRLHEVACAVSRRSRITLSAPTNALVAAKEMTPVAPTTT